MKLARIGSEVSQKSGTEDEAQNDVDANKALAEIHRGADPRQPSPKTLQRTSSKPQPRLLGVHRSPIPVVPIFASNSTGTTGLLAFATPLHHPL
jgi:hypothetical protein